MSSFPVIPGAFSPPRAGAVDVLVIAGEHSGDQHAAKVVADLLEANPGLRIAAFGGPRTTTQVRIMPQSRLFEVSCENRPPAVPTSNEARTVRALLSGSAQRAKTR